MFPLPTDAAPRTAADWHDALSIALAWWFTGNVRSAVDGAPPTLSRIDLDLSRCRLNDRPPPDLAVVGPTDPGVTVATLSVRGNPVVVRDVPVAVELSATDAQLRVGRNAAGGTIAVLADAADGRLAVHLSPVDLDAALTQAARLGAAAQGVDVRSVHAHLTARGPRAVDVALDVTVKKFMTFTVRVTGHVAVDDAMVATATNLKVDGTGMAAAFAAGVMRPQLAKVEGQPLALSPLVPVRLRDVTVDVSDGMSLTAAFGGAE